MIIRMLIEYERELNDFIYAQNQRKEAFIAWLPDNYDEITALNKDSFFLCIEDNRIVGCMGSYVSLEQKVVRLLGPIILPNYFESYVDQLYEMVVSQLPHGMEEVKLAFFEKNELCRKWCERKHYELYNAERTMIFTGRKQFSTMEMPGNKQDTNIKLFEPKYKDGLALVHPEGVFFTLEELLHELSENNRMLLSIVKDEVTGYVYYEITPDKANGEITLLHVLEAARGKGYGSMLLLHAIEDMVKDHVEKITINVRLDNEGAFRLYTKVGFTESDIIYAYRSSLL